MRAKKYLEWATYSRFKSVRDFAWQRLAIETPAFSPPPSALRILFGGDVTFDLESRKTRDVGAYVFWHKPLEHPLLRSLKRKFWNRLCRLLFAPNLFGPAIKLVRFKEPLAITPENAARMGKTPRRHDKSQFDVDSSRSSSDYAYPFQKIAPVMQDKDLVLVNLESPLSTHPRVRGFFRSDPGYAQAMKKVGISMVSLANNHIFDAGEIGFLDTLKHLEDAGIPYTGAGRNFQDARLGKPVQLDGVKFLFLNYTQHCNSGFASIAREYPGTLPLDRQLIIKDVKTARSKADFVFVVLHWGYENQPNVHPEQVKIAHAIIDAGADAIIGHHPHVPHGIEIYKQRPIVYSLGNLIFGQAREDWSDNLLAEVVIDQGRIQGLIVYPISGRGTDLFQPELLGGARADTLLDELRLKSAIFNTGLAIHNHLGYVRID
jgi:poly-gamma-glutamate synthesis protein (capsule biosynthesis protein)